MRAEVRLEILEGPMQGKVFLFEEHDVFLLGRTPDCQAMLPDDPKVSRRHFLIEINPPQVRLRDLGSLNGTYVNDVRYGGRDPAEGPDAGTRGRSPQVDLRNGDRIRVGRTVLVVRVKVELEAPQPPEERGEKEAPKRAPEAAAGRQPAAAPRPPQQAEEKPTERPAGVTNVPGISGPDSVPGYEIEKRLGMGGFGAVYLARRRNDGREVAVKIMRARVAMDERSRTRFLREIDLMKDLQHRNIVSLIENGCIGNAFFFAMEYCESGSVADQMLYRGGRFSLSDARPIWLQSLQGLVYLHEQNVVHRDLKPGNILIAGPRAEPVPKISDLGLAKNFERAGFSGTTLTGSYAGTYKFIPREQVTTFKSMRPISDVWSMGATFYNMITSRFPRDFRDTRDPLSVILHEDVVPIQRRDPNIPDPVARVIDRSLADEPNARYQTAAEMLDALGKAL